MQKTSIEWSDCTWNPVRGCDKVSTGCKNCYAERFAERWRGIPGHPFEQGFDLRLVPEKLREPLSWKKPQTVFVNSMSDLFHHGVPDGYIQQVFEVMQQAHWHTFQLLTKRSSRLAGMNKVLVWPANVWMGVSVENEHCKFRIEDLRATDAKTKFLSLEPLLGDLQHLDLSLIDWVIAGGESGPGCREIRPEWVRSIRDQCIDQQVPFFFKQWGGVQKSKSGRLLDGREWNELPLHIA